MRWTTAYMRVNEWVEKCLEASAGCCRNPRRNSREGRAWVVRNHQGRRGCLLFVRTLSRDGKNKRSYGKRARVSVKRWCMRSTRRVTWWIRRATIYWMSTGRWYGYRHRRYSSIWRKGLSIDWIRLIAFIYLIKDRIISLTVLSHCPHLKTLPSRLHYLRWSFACTFAASAYHSLNSIFTKNIPGV